MLKNRTFRDSKNPVYFFSGKRVSSQACIDQLTIGLSFLLGAKGGEAAAFDGKALFGTKASVCDAKPSARNAPRLGRLCQKTAKQLLFGFSGKAIDRPHAVMADLRKGFVGHAEQKMISGIFLSLPRLHGGNAVA